MTQREKSFLHNLERGTVAVECGKYAQAVDNISQWLVQVSRILVSRSVKVCIFLIDPVNLYPVQAEVGYIYPCDPVLVTPDRD